jgi:hypothetical protein
MTRGNWLTIIGIAIAFITTILGATWNISSKLTTQTVATTNNTEAIARNTEATTELQKQVEAFQMSTVEDIGDLKERMARQEGPQ